MVLTDTLHKRMVVFIVSLALFMDGIDATIINTAIPAVSHSLQVHPVDLKIALISYLITLAVFIPISGWIGDKYGVKRVFMAAIAIFTLSSLWCGYAHSLLELVLARSAQGLGGALMLPLGRLIILRNFERHELVKAMNHVIMVVSIALMLGPLAGGFITDRFSWHWIFWVNIPVGLFTIGIGAYYLQPILPQKVRPFDSVGFILFGGGLSALTFSLSDLSESSTNQQNVFFIMGLGIVMLIAYFIYSRRQRHPILNTELFRIRTFRISILGNLLSRLSFGGMPFLMPLLLQVALGYSAELSGLLLVPLAFGVLIVKAITLPIFRYFGFRQLLIWNTLLVGFSLWAFMMIGEGTTLYVIAILTFIFGFLISMQYSVLNSIAYADLTSDDLSSAASIMSTVQQLSQSVGVATAALLLRFCSLLSGNPILLTPVIFHQTFFVMGLFTFIPILIFIHLKAEDGHQLLKGR